jgi:hypothetical protein
LRLPGEAHIAELRLDPKVVVVARAKLAEPVVDPALLAADSDEASIGGQLERVRGEEARFG